MVDQGGGAGPAISLGNLEAAVGHDPALVVQLVRQLEASLRLQSSDLERAIELHDLPAIVKTSHRLAGTVAMFGAAALSVVCGQIESAARSADMAAVRTAQAQFASEARRVLAALANYQDRS